jgi:hypothetical protein
MTNTASGSGLDFFDADFDMDSNADVWAADVANGVWRFPHGTQGGSGLMAYGTGTAINYGIPSGCSKVMRAIYDAPNDRLYVGCYSAAVHDPGNQNFGNNVAGNTIIRFDGFEAHGGGFPAPKWTAAIPYGAVRTQDNWNTICNGGVGTCATQMARNIRIAGSYIFMDNTDPIYTYPGPFTGLNPIDDEVFNIQAFNVSDGSFAGNIWPGTEVNYFSTNWDDIQSSFTAFKQSTGQYLILQQNETNAAINLYRGLLQNFTQS